MLRDVWDGHSEAYQSAPRRISLRFQRKRSIQFRDNASTAHKHLQFLFLKNPDLI